MKHRDRVRVKELPPGMMPDGGQEGVIVGRAPSGNYDWRVLLDIGPAILFREEELELVPSEPKRPDLALASTRELLEELARRGEAGPEPDGNWLAYVADQLPLQLRTAVLDDRTVES